MNSDIRFGFSKECCGGCIFLDPHHRIDPCFYLCRFHGELIPEYSNKICDYYLVIKVQNGGIINGGFGYFTEEESIKDREKKLKERKND